MAKNDLKSLIKEIKLNKEPAKAVFSFRISIDLLNTLREVCEKEEIPMGLFIEKVLKIHLDNEK